MEAVEASTGVVEVSMDVSDGKIRGSAIQVAVEVSWEHPCTSTEEACMEATMEAAEACSNNLKCCGSTLKLVGVRRSQWK